MSGSAPTEGLLVHPVGDELLIYDRRSGRLLWLNAEAAWRLEQAGLLASTDGWPTSRSVRQLVRALRQQPGAAVPRVATVQLGQAVHAEAAGPCRNTGERCGPAQPPCCPGLECQAGAHGRGVCRA
jgi:hypothetical protein